jgi:SAM-dependent methyltransferase
MPVDGLDSEGGFFTLVPIMAAPNAPKPKTAPLNGRLWGARSQDWAEVQEGQVRAAYEAVFSRVGISKGTLYCDVGCGSGMAAQIAAGRGARVSGLDASESLLEIARARVPQGDFRLGEMEDLPFADRSFDLVTGFNAFQYAADPGAALSEAGRVAKPGALVVIMTWGKPEGMEAASLVAALRPLLPSPPPGAPGPFALSEESALRSFVAQAGLKPMEVSDVDCPWFYPDLATALRGLGSSGVAMRARENSGEGAVDQAHEVALAPFRQANGSYRLGASFRWLLASA